jgi:hypothetical protein
VSIALILAMLVVEKGMNENGAPCSWLFMHML